ncbi:MAG TPA: glycosyl hydrolase 53 family protein, partial [Bacteroidota bacterium]|nr:glycosyl hydrolase 53 family protein [Bacteroidota bacterium]
PPETGYLEMGSDGAGKSSDGSTISVDSRSVILNGKPWLPVMGEFHFSRYPRKYWGEEILKMKAGGIQIVSTYIFWIHHEEIEGKFEWSGQRDLRAFVGLCARNGMYVFPRIGPWAHGEARNGGFPDWLMKKGPTRVDDSTFLFHVGTFYREIGRQLKGLIWKEGGPVIGIQIENEYANRAPNGGNRYLMALKQIAMEAGLDVPLYTITGWDNAVIPPRSFIPVYGGYPDEAWSGSNRELLPDPQGVFQFHVATPVGTAGIMQAATAPPQEVPHSHYPRFTAELGGGMEVTYHRRVVISADDIASMALSALGSGVNLLGYYMFHGGTNPDGKLTTLQESQATGYPNDVPVMSYDFQAPLGEFGQANESYRKLKSLHMFIHDFGSDLALMSATQADITPTGPRDTTTLRVASRTDGKHGFLFFNNYLRNYPLPEHRSVQVLLKLPSDTLDVPSKAITIPAQSSFIWPINLDMNGALLKYATAQLVAAISDEKKPTYFFSAIPKVDAEFVFEASTVHSARSRTGSVTSNEGRIWVRGLAASTASAIAIKTREGKEVNIVLMSREQSSNAWRLRIAGRERMVISPAQVFAVNDTLHLRSRNPKSLQILLYPKPDRQIIWNGAIQPAAPDGIFAKYSFSVHSVRFPVGLKESRKAGTVPPVNMGPYFDWRACAVASSPVDSTFEKAAEWRLTLPRKVPGGVSDLYLGITYTGDAARLLSGNQLLDDNFYNGVSWEVGLKRFWPDIQTKGLLLSVLPLRKDAPIYIPGKLWPSFNGGMQVDGVKSVTLTPEYEVAVSLVGENGSHARDFQLGADISFVAAPGRGRYAQKRIYREGGKPSDELTILSNHGWKTFRLRVFVSPVRDAPDNSLENTIPLAKRIKASGAAFGLDFHFSDTWADPQHQDIPLLWSNLSFDSLETRVEVYAKDVISQLKNADALPDWVQIGNEITRGTFWPLAQVQMPGSTQYNPPAPYDEARQWDHLTRILKAAIRGVQGAAGKTRPRIAIHIDQGANWPVTKWFFDHLESAGVEYDIIAESFYPEWHHGTLEGLQSNMIKCADRYHKDFLVAETGYDSSRVARNEDMRWPVTPEGRLQFMADLVNTVRRAPNGIGVLYWAPERGLWGDDGEPGPTVFVMDSLESLTSRPRSLAPHAIMP